MIFASTETELSGPVQNLGDTGIVTSSGGDGAMSDDRKRSVDFDRLARNPEFRRHWRSVVAGREDVAHEYSVHEATVLASLRTVGVETTGLKELSRAKSVPPAAVDVLMREFAQATYDSVQLMILRVVGRKGRIGRRAAPLLAAALADPAVVMKENVRWSAADKLAIVADASVLPQLLRLAEDVRLGRSREMVALALGNVDDPAAVAALLRLVDDPETCGHAVKALGRLRAVAAADKIRQLLSHPQDWVRREAHTALDRIEGRT